MKTKKRHAAVIIWTILAIGCALYGVKVFLAGSGTAFFLIWFFIGACCFGLALASRFALWDRVPKVWKRIICAAVYIGLCVFIFVEGLIFSHFFDKGEDDLDYIIILGAQVYKDKPSPILQFRLNTAIDYLSENPDTVCIVSGGQGYNEPFPEAEGMARYLEGKGIDKDKIIQEPHSGNTEENIRNSMAFIHDGASVGIVTNNFHVFRTLKTAQRLGLDNVCGIAAYTTIDFIPNNMLREFFGVVKFCLT